MNDKQDFKNATASECQEHLLFCNYKTEDLLHDLKDNAAFQRILILAKKYEKIEQCIKILDEYENK